MISSTSGEFYFAYVVVTIMGAGYPVSGGILYRYNLYYFTFSSTPHVGEGEGGFATNL